MRILMTRDQMIKVALNAINASTSLNGAEPVEDATIEEVKEGISLRAGQYQDIQISHKGNINIDGFRGRQVKLFIQRFRAMKKEDDIFSVYDTPADPNYHTWATTYPSHLALVQSVIANPIIEEDDWELVIKKDEDESNL